MQSSTLVSERQSSCLHSVAFDEVDCLLPITMSETLWTKLSRSLKRNPELKHFRMDFERGKSHYNRDLVARRRRKIWGNLLVTGIPLMHSSCFSELPQAEFSALKCKFPASNRSFPLNASCKLHFALKCKFPRFDPPTPRGVYSKTLKCKFSVHHRKFLALKPYGSAFVAFV